MSFNAHCTIGDATHIAVHSCDARRHAWLARPLLQACLVSPKALQNAAAAVSSSSSATAAAASSVRVVGGELVASVSLPSLTEWNAPSQQLKRLYFVLPLLIEGAHRAAPLLPWIVDKLLATDADADADVGAAASLPGSQAAPPPSRLCSPYKQVRVFQSLSVSRSCSRV
jgi:hypothetical protein